MPGPGKYGDIGKAANDLLTKDFKFTRALEVETVSSNDVTLTATNTLSGNAIASSLKAKTKCHIGFLDSKLTSTYTYASDNSLECEFEADRFLIDGLSAATTYNIGGSPQLEASLTSATDVATVEVKLLPLGQTSKVSCKTAFGYNSFRFGAEVGYKIANAAMGERNIAAAYNGDGFSIASVCTNLGERCELRYLQAVGNDTNVAGSVVYSADKGNSTFVIGVSHVLDSDTTFKIKAANSGVVSGALIWKAKPFLTAKLAAEVNAMHLGDDVHKFGLQLNFQ